MLPTQLSRSFRALRIAMLLSGCLMACIAAAQSLEIIELRYRTAAEVIPILQPLLEPGGALTGQDYKLFVRASSANLAQLRKALAAIDQQPRQFLVSVRRGTRQEMEREQAAASAAIGSDGANVTLRATESAGQRDSNGVTSVSVLEGNAAFIATGQSVPIVTSVIAGGGNRPRIGMSTGYRDLSSGFTVTPRLAGEQIALDISQQTEQRAADGSGIQTQRLSTQVTGRLGEWLPLGGVRESSQAQSRGILSGQYATQSDEQTIWVKVVLGDR
jgi:type II secretory pathway component GspD/PulD (secretin)